MQFSALNAPPQPSFNQFAPSSSNQQDLSDIGKQASKEREMRSLSLRRKDSPFGSSSFRNANCAHGQRNINFSGSSIDNENNEKNDEMAKLDVEMIIASLNSGDPVQISSTMNSVQNALLANNGPGLNAFLNGVLNSGDFSEALVNSLSGSLPQPVIIQIMDVVAFMFPNIDEEIQRKYVDDGLTLSLIEPINSDSVPVVYSSINLVSILADTSGYARDSLISFGIHSMLIDIASAGATRDMMCNISIDAKVVPENLVELSCSTIHHIFENPSDIDLDTLSSCVGPILPLLNLQSITAVDFVIQTFVDITNKMPSLVNVLYECGLYPSAVQLLGIPQLLKSSLRLIGNLSVGQPMHVLSLLEAGLFNSLIELLATVYAPDAIWIMSNLVEMVYEEIQGMLNEGLIAAIFEISEKSFDAKKESSFFIATIIIKSPKATLGRFINETIAAVLTEILVCGDRSIILRCIDAILLLLTFESNVGSSAQLFLSFLVEMGIADHLRDISENNENGNILQRVNDLLEWIP